MKTYYDILGIQKTATEAEVRTAFRKKAKETHPDVNGNAGAAHLFMEVNEAYEILIDARKRRIYDERITPRVRVPHTPSQTQTHTPPPSPPDPRTSAREYDEWVRKARAQASQRAKMNYKDFERSTAEKVSDGIFIILQIPLMFFGLCIAILFMALPVVLMIYRSWWMGIFAAVTIPAGIRIIKMLWANLREIASFLR